jgi:hypothetical protein
LREVADEIIESETSLLDGSLLAAYENGELPRLRSLIRDPERAFNKSRDRLKVAKAFGSINLVVFRNAMGIGAGAVDVREVAKRAVIRSGVSGYHRDRGFAGCK